MNIYFLVEGEAELGVYPTWINFLLDSKLQRATAFDTVSENQYFIFDGGGIGKMIHHSIKNAIQDISNHPVFDWLVIIADADDQTVTHRKALIETVFTNLVLTLPTNCQKKIIIQNRCFETGLCGNEDAFIHAQSSTNKNVQRFLNFYNVAENDPELMLKDLDPRFASLTLAKYHAAYLHHLLLPNKYNKGSAHKLIDIPYLEKLKNRLTQTPTHLITLNEMLSFLQFVQTQI